MQSLCHAGAMLALLRVRALGAFEIDGLSEHAIGSRKARTLLKVLALARGAPVSSDVLVDALWSDGAPAHPADQVAVLVSRLRTVLGADRLRRADAGYALHADWLDIVEFDARADDATARLRAGGFAGASAAALAALQAVQVESVIEVQPGGVTLTSACEADVAAVIGPSTSIKPITDGRGIFNSLRMKEPHRRRERPSWAALASRRRTIDQRWVTTTFPDMNPPWTLHA